MSESEERSHGVPDETAAETIPVRAPEETERAADPKKERSGRLIGLLMEVALLGWALARSYFGKAPIPNRTAAAAAPVPIPGKTGRAADRDLESGSNLAMRRRWGTLFVACAFAIGVAAGVGFVFVYWSGGNNLLMGGALALFLGGFGSALVLYPRWLMSREEATGPREKLPSSTDEREAVLEEYCAGVRGVQRRSLLKWIGAAGMGIVAAMVFSLMRSLGMSPSPSLFSTVWKRGQRLMTVEGKPISVDSLQPGSSVTVFPEDSLGSEKAQTVLIRVKEQLLQLPTGRANWAPMGYVAYSRVCTHAGCSVGLFESGTNLLLCPCHQSTFNVLRGAQPTGGPAARPLPQLPLYADGDGFLRAAGGFTEPPGPGFGGMS